MKWLTILAVVALAGCIQRPMIMMESKGLGGVQSEPEWAVISYSVTQTGKAMKEQTKRARKLMKEYCEPDSYRIEKWTQKESQELFFYEGSGGTSTKNKIYMKFVCVKADSKMGRRG